MPNYVQTGRLLAVTTPLGPEALLLAGFEGREALSELFRFRLTLLAENRTAVPFDAILGRDVTVELALPDGGKRAFRGIINRLTQGRRDADFTYFRAEMVPRFWLWTKKVQSRIFQHLSVPDILKQVLAGLDVTFELRGNYAPRDYCVQYRESDFAFASRLMEEEGIAYYFKHTADGPPLVVTDVGYKHPELPAPNPVVYEEVEGGGGDGARVTAWEKSQEVRAGRYTLWDHCFELPGKNLEAQQAVQEGVAVGRVTHSLQVANERLEIYDYPGGYAQRFDGVDKGGGDQSAELMKVFQDNQRTVKIRMEQEAVPALEVDGASACGHFTAGHRFTLARHFDADGPYLLTRVEHEARLSGNYRSGEGVHLDYRNRFTAIPAALPYRPARVTPRPTIAGTQTATVVGPAGEEIFIDKYGRVKVQFHWDRHGKRDANSSCWVRVAQVWAGRGWGAFFWPRVGHEVVVAFEEGDPDQPVIVGSVYNAANMPPFALPQKRMLGGIKSASVRGNAREHFNGIVFTDEKGHEHLAIHSERHMTFNAEYDKSFHAGRHKNEQVSNVSTFTVGALPGGGGSGGGPDDYNPMGSVKPQGVPGLNSIMVYGENLQVAVGLNNQLAVGTNLQICVNPTAIATALGLPIPPAVSAILGSGIGGNMQMTLGTNANIVWGNTFNINLGGEDFKPGKGEHLGTKITCAIFGAVVLTWVIAYGEMKTADARVTLVVVFEVLIGALLAAIMVMEAAYAEAEDDLLKGLGTIFNMKDPKGKIMPMTVTDALRNVGELAGALTIALSPAIIAAAAEPGPADAPPENVGTITQA